MDANTAIGSNSAPLFLHVIIPPGMAFDFERSSVNQENSCCFVLSGVVQHLITVLLKVLVVVFKGKVLLRLLSSESWTYSDFESMSILVYFKIL